MLLAKNIAIIIVGYRNPSDVRECLEALLQSSLEPQFDIYICENGGATAFEVLVDVLVGVGGPCVDTGETSLSSDEIPRFLRVRDMELRKRQSRVLVAEASENRGYAGGINAWLRVLQSAGDWPGVWVLNPDTQPDRRALAELVDWSATRMRGMVGSLIVPLVRPNVIRARGLRWRRLLASTEAIDFLAPSSVEPDTDALEARLDSPSGASFYVTRSCLERIGLMDERYFLTFEDLDWGCRAKQLGQIGHAQKSIVPHRGGTTTGASGKLSERSKLSVYLEFRNRLLFVRTHHPAWFAWTVLVVLIRPLIYGCAGAPGAMRVAYLGVFRGLAGETGRPDRLLESHGSQWGAPRFPSAE